MKSLPWTCSTPNNQGLLDKQCYFYGIQELRVEPQTPLGMLAVVWQHSRMITNEAVGLHKRDIIVKITIKTSLGNLLLR